MREREQRRNRRGMSVVEAVIASAVAATGAMAMIYAIAMAHASIRSMRIERAAVFTTQKRMEELLALPPSDTNLSIGNHGPLSSSLPYGTAQTTWAVAWVDDALDGTGNGDSNVQDYRKLEVTVTWTDVIARSTKLCTYLYP